MGLGNDRGSPPCRKPNILDGLILVAATAAGLTLAGAGVASFGWADGPGIAIRLAGATRLASCMVLMWSLVFLAIRCRRPRPALRDAARQPGMIACCAACLSALFGAIVTAPSAAALIARPGAFPAQNLAVSIMSSTNIAHSVVAAWMALALTGTIRPEKGWIDRLGVTLGAFWVLALGLLACLVLL